MKLHECTFGRMVITKDEQVGYVVGVTYNINIAYTGTMSNSERFQRTIPVVRFADGERGIHHSNLQPFRG